jgi:integrase
MLSDTAIRNSKPRIRPYKLFDGEGLYLLINPNDSRWWRFKYRLAGKEKLLSFGVYPDVSLKLARQMRSRARERLAQGIDPSLLRQSEKTAQANTFEAVAREWLVLQAKKLAPTTFAKATWTLETLVFPYIGGRPIAKITAADVLRVLKRIEGRGTHETAHRTRQRCSQVFRYAVVTGRAEHDVTISLRGALAPVDEQHHAAITQPQRIGELLRAIDGYSGHIVTHLALKLAPLVFARPGELRAAVWAEIDLNRREWRIAAERMKMREEHIVPLSAQALAILKELIPITGNSRYLFPSLNSGARPMSENTINSALRRLGYTKEEMTGHGFRSMASTCLNEQGWNPDVIELQLAHAERNRVRAAYNRAQRLPERQKMMQGWADYLDGLRSSSNVIPFKKKN